MGAPDLSSLLWPDAGQGRQPRSGTIAISALTTGLQFAATPLYDFVARRSHGTPNASILRVGPGGIGVSSPPGTVGLATSYAPNLGGDFTVAVVATMISGLGQCMCLGWNGTYSWWIGAWGGVWACKSNYLADAALTRRERPQVVVVTRKGGVEQIYVDGIKSSTSSAFATQIGDGSSRLVLSSYGTAGNYNWDTGQVFGAFVWDRALSGSEIVAFADNPWQVIDPPLQMGWPVSAATAALFDAQGIGHTSGSAALATQIALAGVGVGLAAAVAGINTGISLSASGAGAAQAGAALATGIDLAGGASGEASGSADIMTPIPLSAVSYAVAGGTADLSASITLSAEALAGAAGAAGLSASVLLAGAGAAAASGQAGLVPHILMAAAGSAQASGAGELAGSIRLYAQGQSSAAGIASLLDHPQARMAAAGAAQAAGSADLLIQIRLAATGAAAAQGSGGLTTAVRLSAAGFAQAMAAGALTTQIPLAAGGAGQASGAGSLLVVRGTPQILISDSRYLVVAAPRDFRTETSRTFQVFA